MRIWGVTDLFPFADIDIFLLECPLLYKNYFEFFSCGAFSSQSILLGNIPLALSMPGTAGQSTMPNVADLYSGMGTLSTNPILGQSMQYTNTAPASSSNPWLQGLSLIPGDIASTALNLINWGITPPGYTPGGLPTEYKVLSGPVGFGPTTYWLRASRSDQTELRAHATSIN